MRCPVLVVHGERDEIVPYAIGARLAEWTGGEPRHRAGRRARAMPLRDPVRFTLLVARVRRALAGPAARHAAAGPRPAAGAAGRCSSPRAIGLGHALRDVAIADELRALHPDLEIDWLAQHPVTRVLADRGERVHPASRFLASESAHVEARGRRARPARLPGDPADGRDPRRQLPCVPRRRRATSSYDLVVADEGWEIDHFLHENPELKRTAYAWLTDFVGWLPMPDGGPREAALTADYNAEMVEQIARYPRLRDRSVFVGDPDDLVDRPARPRAADRARLDPGALRLRRLRHRVRPRSTATTVRAELGCRPDERVCLVTVGGSGVGGPLLRRVVEAHPYAAKRVPGLRTVVVTGPRIDPASVPAPGGRRGARATCPACTGCSPPATSRSSRAG